MEALAQAPHSNSAVPFLADGTDVSADITFGSDQKYCENLDCTEFLELAKQMQMIDTSPLDPNIDKINSLERMIEENNYSIFNDAVMKNYFSGTGADAVILPIVINGISITDVFNKQKHLENILSNMAKKMTLLKIKDMSGRNINFSKEYIRHYFNTKMIDKLENNIFKYGKLNKIIINLAEDYRKMYDHPNFLHMTKHTCGIYYKDNTIYICNSGCDNLPNTILINHMLHHDGIETCKIKLFLDNKTENDKVEYISIILFSMIRCILDLQTKISKNESIKFK